MTQPRDEPPPTSITAYPDGPLVVRGAVEFRDENGAIINQPRRTVALCRCAKSTILPWCDGSHKLGRQRGTSRDNGSGR